MIQDKNLREMKKILDRRWCREGLERQQEYWDRSPSSGESVHVVEHAVKFAVTISLSMQHNQKQSFNIKSFSDCTLPANIIHGCITRGTGMRVDRIEGISKKYMI